MFDWLRPINENNSTLQVQCDARGICEMRYTQVCDGCKHNCGREKHINYFKPKKK